MINYGIRYPPTPAPSLPCLPKYAAHRRRVASLAACSVSTPHTMRRYWLLPPPVCTFTAPISTSSGLDPLLLAAGPDANDLVDALPASKSASPWGFGPMKDSTTGSSTSPCAAPMAHDLQAEGNNGGDVCVATV